MPWACTLDADFILNFLILVVLSLNLVRIAIESLQLSTGNMSQ